MKPTSVFRGGMYRSREQQEYAEILRNYLQSPASGVLLLHGGAGLGKTRAFLAESLNARERVLVATATTQLVQQMLTSQDVAQTATGKQVEAYLSQRQFISPSRAKIFGLEASNGEAVEAVLGRYARDLDPSSICLTSRCPVDERQVYLDTKARCLSADLVVCTHAALLLDVRANGALIDAKSFGCVIVDEADRLPAAAALQTDIAVALPELERMGVKTNLETSALLAASIAAVQEELEATKQVDRRDELIGLRSDLAEILNYAVNEDAYHRVGRTSDAIMLKVLNPARRLRNALTQVPKVILTSGTLAIDGQFNSTKHAFGLYDIHPLSEIIEPRDHGTLSFFLADRSLVVDTDAWLTYCADAITEATSIRERNVLVLTTSFELTEKLATLLPIATAQRRGQQLNSVLKGFSGGVLITPGAWEGVDLNIAWDDIVIPRIPYPQAEDVLDLPFLSLQDTAIRRLTQGMARGLRRPEQHSTVWILDPRFPVPFEKVNQGTMTQGAAAHHLRLTGAIPKRFREGLRSTYRKAEIFRPRNEA